jgi:hypothetical protein
MTKKAPSVPTEDVYELLAAITEVLDLPTAATYEALEVRARLMVDRAATLCGALGSVVEARRFDDSPFTPRDMAELLRRMAVEYNPVKYPTAEEGGGRD